MQKHSWCWEGLWFPLHWGCSSDISQGGYTTLHDTSSLVMMESLVNPKLFWEACCWCARADYLFCVVSCEFQALLLIKLSVSKRVSILGVSQKCSQHWSSLLIKSSESKRGQFIPLFPRFSSMSRTCFFSCWLEICLSATIFLFSRSYKITND